MPLPTIPSGNVASATASTSFDVDYSCKFDRASSAYMDKSSSTSSNNDIYTISFWMKRAGIEISDNIIFSVFKDSNNRAKIGIGPHDSGADRDHKLELYDWYGGSQILNQIVNVHLVDPTAWMHICIRVDTTQSSANDRIRVYYNGVDQASNITRTTTPTQNQNLGFQETTASNQWRIGSHNGGGDYFDGYLAEVCYCDGQSYAPTEFGEYDSDSPSIWKPKNVSGLTFGNNGFYLDFKASGNLGNDANGGTDLNENNIVAADQMIDTPTNNFPTFNPIVTAGASDGSVYTMGYTEGNLQGATNGAQGPLTQIIPNQGKWFCELHFNHATADSDPGTIIATLTSLQNYHWYQSGHIGIVFKWHGDIYENGSDSGTNSDAYTTNDIISLAINRDDNQITLYKNGSVMTNANARSFSNLGNYDDFVIAYQDGANSSTYDTLCDLNAGQNGTFNGRKTAGGNADGNGYGNFSMAVPTGYYSLCSKNIAEFG